MRGKRNTDRNTRKFISIPDTQKWEQIDELMAKPKYEKSFNKVINEALDCPIIFCMIYGLRFTRVAKNVVLHRQRETILLDTAVAF